MCRNYAEVNPLTPSCEDTVLVRSGLQIVDACASRCQQGVGETSLLVGVDGNFFDDGVCGEML